MWLMLMVNVGRYTIQGCYGNGLPRNLVGFSTHGFIVVDWLASLKLTGEFTIQNQCLENTCPFWMAYFQWLCYVY